jgi:class 3 adenylate cyclase
VRRLRAVDIVLLATLAPLWLVAVTLHTVQASRDRVALPALHVAGAATADAYPTLRGYLAGSVQQNEPAPGAALLRVGEFDLRGAGPLRFIALCYAAADAELRIPIRYRHGEQVRSASVPFARSPYPLRMLPLVLAAGVMAILLLLRARIRVEARAFFLFGVVYSVQWALFPGPVAWQTYLSLGIALATVTLFAPLTLRALLLFPASAGPRTALGRGWPWLFCIWGPAFTSWVFGWPLSSEAGLFIIYLLNLLCIACVLIVITLNYRRSDAAGRRQLRWLLWGFYVGLLPVALGAGVAAVDPRLTWLYELSIAALALVPLGFFIAVVREDFLDIDRLITQTASYTVVVLVLLALLVQVIPAGARVVAESSGIDPAAAQTLLFVAFAAAAVPARRWVSPWAEAVFYRERSRLERDLQSLRAELGDQDDPGQLFKFLGEQLSRLLRPHSCVIYAGAGSSLEPVVALAASVPPAFANHGDLVTLLGEHAAPVDARRWRRWLRTGTVRGAEAAALESLQPDVILPVQGDEHLVAFVCLGPKRSGDIYAKSELAWLAAVADRASRQLLRFGDAEMIRHGRELRQKLARYVPGPIADRLERGQDIQARERDVTILFADIRSYTPYAESRDAEEIFSMVSRYTETVSAIVLRHGGHVVEFHGDGLMAVFGAPDALARKEEAAVAAALEIVDAVPLLSEEGTRLEVGVGAATGPAFVGNIESTDRLIWGAIGNTTNLAARMQGLTRDLDASIAIENVTYERAGARGAGFQRHPDVLIRGRSEPFLVWSLPR